MPLRWSDLDAQGHVSQSAYHELLEAPRGDLVLGLGTVAPNSFVTARVELNYRCEVTLADRFVRVASRVEKIGRSSVTIAHEIHRPDGTLAADGLAVLVAWDGLLRRSRPLSVSERRGLAGDLRR